MMRSCPWSLLLIAPALLIVSPTGFAATISINFEGPSDSTFISTQYPGVTFSNAIILKSGISLNELDFPPRSGVNVASDSGGGMSLIFSTPVQNFLAYFTYTVPVTLQAFDSSNRLLTSVRSLFATNTVSGGVLGSNPNELIQVASAPGLSRVVITGDPAGSSFVLDDASFTTGQATSTPAEPSSMVLTGLVVLLGAAKARFRRS